MSTVDVTLGDVTLHCLVQGPANGPLALCLHGFPDTPYTFRHLIPVLTDAGFRVVTPFMRGYAPSSPSSRGDYRIEALASDANDLHQHFGGDERAILIGHDWGAAGAYGALNAEPDRWRRAVTMSIPPLGAFATMLQDVDQLKSSWYMFFFQSARRDAAVRQGNFEFLRRLWSDWSPGYDASFDMALVRETLANEENLAAALEYYRSIGGAIDAEEPRHVKIRSAMWSPCAVPLLYLHGEHDGCVRADRLGDLAPFLSPPSEVRLVPGVGHFLHLERPEVVNGYVESFLRG